MSSLPSAVVAHVTVWRGDMSAASRVLPEETAVVLTYDRVSFAVMMATPANLEDFALGFSLTERIIETPSDITSLEIVILPDGIECRMSLTPLRRDALEARRRHIAGPAGCGLCGIDRLAEAVRPPAQVAACLRISAIDLSVVLARLPALQVLNRQTRAVHAAAFFTPVGDRMLVREDVGRHNALDKLVGAVTREGLKGDQGIVIMTSRVSIELIQKTAALGAGIFAAVSVPTARAVQEAERAGITLIAVARDDGFEIFSHPKRIIEACAPCRSTG